jgi:hypothetical protein
MSLLNNRLKYTIAVFAQSVSKYVQLIFYYNRLFESFFSTSIFC